ncbi:MAG: hypothetical protein LC774_16765 [Acidobacteria bacterium]|nr:hypothetical protein [Acidobacteriota bacterium]
MALRIWFLAIMCALSVATRASRASLPAVGDQATEAPFTLEGGSIVMRMTVKGKGSFKVLLATAAPVSKFSFDALKAMGRE